MEDQRSAIRSLSVRSSILHSQSSIFRRAFSFAEVMFAVVILGIGFIMVAAVFPVAIRQTQSSTEENTAANAARTAASAIMSLPLTLPNPYRAGAAMPYTQAAVPATVTVFPPTIKNYWLGTGTGVAGQSVVPPPAVVVPFIGTRGNLLYSNIIQNTDPRYSYVAFYKRENNSSVAELIVIAVANRNRAAYDSTDLPNSNSQAVVNVNLIPQDANSTSQQQTTKIFPDAISFTTPPANVTLTEGCTASLTATPPIPGSLPYPPAVRTFAFGRPLIGGTYEINPGDGITLTPNSQTGLWGDISYVSSVTPPDYKDKRVKDTDSVAMAAAVFNGVSTLQPTVAYVQSIVATTANPTGQITLSVGPQNQNGVNINPAPNAVTGAFVIIADDCPFDYRGTDIPGSTQDYQIPPNTANYQVGRLNGRIFRLGTQVVQDSNGVAQSGTFLLDPAFGMRPGVPDGTIIPIYPETTSTVYGPDSFPSPYMPNSTGGIYGQSGPCPITARCYIIGAGKDPTTGKPAGTAQDLGAFATYFQVQ